MKTYYIAKTLFGLEKILAEELVNLGAQEVKELRRAVGFYGNDELMMKANLHLRTAIKILQPVHNFTANDENSLYKGISSIYWDKYFSTSDTFAIDSIVNSKYFKHSKYAALKAKDAIVDQFRRKTGIRPSIDTERPTISINLHIADEKCTVSLDTSGQPLNRRGYRPGGHPAPLNENLAAGMIIMSGYKGDKPFVDGMCGSGTILIEAAMIAGHIAPGLQRTHFAFMNWSNFDSKLFEKLKTEAREAIKKIEYPIVGGDISSKAISVARENIERSILKSTDIEISQRDFADLIPPSLPGIIIMNPPYDERLALEDSIAFYKKIGDVLKSKYDGYDAWIISGNIAAIKQIGLKTSEKHHLLNGPIECKYHKYQMYRGSLKNN